MPCRAEYQHEGSDPEADLALGQHFGLPAGVFVEGVEKWFGNKIAHCINMIP